jgi:hypothetical protein
MGILMCASPSLRGGVIGLQQLRVPLEHLGMCIYPHTLGIGDAKNQLSDHGIGNAKDQAFFETCIHDFVRKTQAVGVKQ